MRADALPRRAAAWLLAALAAALLAGPRPLAAQWPGEVAGRVSDAATGSPVEAAWVEIPELGRAARTDGTGAFRLRGLEPGVWRLVARGTGYAAAEASVRVRNGEVERVTLALHPAVVTLEALAVRAEGPALAAGATRMDRAQIEAAGARTAGDVVARMPGVVVRETGATGAQTASVRGSGAGAVLVLVDGVAANDPVTGEADLSAIPAHALESVTLVPGAQTARYGPRAEAGVVLVATRAPGRSRAAALSGGSLGERAARAEWGGGARMPWSAGASVRRVDGAFRHPRDPSDPTPVVRRNADLEEWSAFAAAQADAAGGELRLRGGWETLHRGIPGLGYAPSPQARQSLHRARASLAWRRWSERGAASLSLAGVSQRARYADPAPPFGLPFDTRTRVQSLVLRAEGERSGAGWLRGWGGGVEAAGQRVEAGSLSTTAPRGRVDGGVFAHATAGTEWRRAALELSAQARADRDGITGGWYGTHALALAASAGALRAQVAHRSSFSPPSLGDQFFREGVAVAPNPALRPERVPSEWEAGLSAAGAVGGAALSGGATAFRSDVRGMIAWLPDYRFVWSPRNTDVRRRGGELWGEAALPAHALRLSGAWSLAAVTYDRPGTADDAVQVAYRPRHTGRAEAAWSPGPWRLSLGARYTGTRYPDPSPDNPLPGFWTLEGSAGRGWRVGRWMLDAGLRVDRLRDETDPLIAGYPEPGRRAVLSLRVHGAGEP